MSMIPPTADNRFGEPQREQLSLAARRDREIATAEERVGFAQRQLRLRQAELKHLRQYWEKFPAEVTR